MARELTVMACASHAERVAQRWDGLEGRIKDKLASLGLDQQAVGRLLTQAIRSSTRAKKVMWLRQAADAAAMRAQPHNKIEAHQNDPGALTAMRIAKQIETEAQSRVVGLYTPAGLPLLEVEVQGNTLRLKIGPEPARATALRRLEQGQELKLELHDKKKPLSLLNE